MGLDYEEAARICKEWDRLELFDENSVSLKNLLAWQRALDRKVAVLDDHPYDQKWTVGILTDVVLNPTRPERSTLYLDGHYLSLQMSSLASAFVCPVELAISDAAVVDGKCSKECFTLNGDQHYHELNCPKVGED